MNIEKNPRQARKMLKEQAKLRKLAKQGRIKDEDRYLLEQDVVFEDVQPLFERPQEQLPYERREYR